MSANTKFTITVTGFAPFRRNTLRGFASVHIDELKLTIHDVTIHEHGSGARWASLPSKPTIDRDGVARRTDDGKVKYTPLFQSDSRTVSDAFGAATIKALIGFDAQVFDREAVS